MKWHILLVSIVIAMSIVSSCEKTKKVEPPTPEPKIIGSQILDEGKESNVKAVYSKESTKLSYKSWLMVRAETKAMKESKVEVELQNEFRHIDTSFIVKSFEMGDYKTSIYRRVRNISKNGNITKIDSVFVYKIDFDEFTFEYELDFDVAVYDDGFSRQELPYYGVDFTLLKDKGCTELSSMKSYDDGVRAYARKNFTHTIEIECAGKQYVATANVILKKDIGSANDDYLIETEYGQSYLDPPPRYHGDGYAMGHIWQNWSKSGWIGITLDCKHLIPRDCRVAWGHLNLAEFSGHNYIYKYLPWGSNDKYLSTIIKKDLELKLLNVTHVATLEELDDEIKKLVYPKISETWPDQDASITIDASNKNKDYKQYITIKGYGELYHLSYNYPEFNSTLYYIWVEVWYDDGYLKFKFPGSEHKMEVEPVDYYGGGRLEQEIKWIHTLDQSVSYTTKLFDLLPSE